MNENDRRRILERRERFLRASLCGVAAGALLAACDPTGPVCHSARRNIPRTIVKVVGCDAYACLSVAYIDAGAPAPVSDAGTDGDE